MKLALCLFKHYPFGGLEYDFIRIVQACQQRGYIVDIYTFNWQGQKPKGLNIITIPVCAWTNHGKAKAFARKLQAILPNKHYDAVLGFNRIPGLDFYFAADICYEEDVKKRHNCLYRLTQRYRLYSSFERAVFSPKSKTQILYIAPPQKTAYQKYYQTPDERFHLLPAGIDKKFLAPENAADIRNKIRAQYQTDESKKIVLFVGSDFERKGVDRAIRAIASLPSTIRSTTCLWIIGKGLCAKYQKLAKQLKAENQIKFLGTSTDVPNLMLASDCLIHPARREAAGNVLLEALASSLPVLTTDTCGFAYHIQQADAGKVIASPFQQHALNTALNDMLSSNEYEKWRKNALHYAQTEDLYSRPEKALEIIKQSLEKPL